MTAERLRQVMARISVFLAMSRAQGEAFHANALEMGGSPTVRRACVSFTVRSTAPFVRDLDGHKINAMFWDKSAH